MSYVFDEVVKKFSDTTVLFEGKPVQIVEVRHEGDDIFKLDYAPNPISFGARTKTAYIQDAGWDFTSLASRIGYIDIPYGEWIESVYCSRMPRRQTRQGLDSETVMVINPFRDSDYNWNTVKNSIFLNNTINNCFRSLKDSVDLLIGDPYKYKALAVSRRMAVTWDQVNPPNLFYRNERIGYTEDGVTVRLAKHKHFLHEELTDMMGLKVHASK